MDNYNFNEELKRYEPVEKKCTFCETKIWTNIRSNYFVPIYKIKDRTNLIVYNSVKFSKVSIGIPRCSDCLKIHKNAEIKAFLLAVPIGLITCGLAYLIFGIVGFIFGAGVGLVVIIISQIILAKKIVHKSGILQEREGAERNQIVQAFLRGGWTLNKPDPKG
jgi:hypothetical protein